MVQSELERFVNDVCTKRIFTDPVYEFTTTSFPWLQRSWYDTIHHSATDLTAWTEASKYTISSTTVTERIRRFADGHDFNAAVVCISMLAATHDTHHPHRFGSTTQRLLRDYLQASAIIEPDTPITTINQYEVYLP
jgi:hypothetical protein